MQKATLINNSLTSQKQDETEAEAGAGLEAATAAESEDKQIVVLWLRMQLLPADSDVSILKIDELSRARRLFHFPAGAGTATQWESDWETLFACKDVV